MCRGVIMPVKYVCRYCGYVLWEFQRVGQDYFGVPTPDEIKRVHGVCPGCKRELSEPHLDDIVIKIIKKHIIVPEIEKPVEPAIEILPTKKSEAVAVQEA